jgi:hypothetical protein
MSQIDKAIISKNRIKKNRTKRGMKLSINTQRKSQEHGKMPQSKETKKRLKKD